MADSTTAAIEAEGLTKRFGDFTAVRALDLRVETGTVVSLLGPNGAGKTTMVRMLATLLRPDAGRARIAGHDVVAEADRVRQAISLTGQFAALDKHLTAAENLRLMVLGIFAFTWTGVLFGMLVRSPDAMQGMGFIIILPLTFMAGTFVPIAGLDAVPRAIAEWDPISALVATVRGLTQGYPSSGSWQLDHPELAMALWCLLILAIVVPLALRRFNRTLAG